MAFFKHIGLVATLLFCMNVLAGEEPPEIKPDRPDTYVVVKGDTLWDISSKYLKNPWQWPRLWRANPQIENPHLIYPGDVLKFVMIDGQPAVMVTYRDLKLYPRTRVEELEEAIKTIPADAIAQFLSSPRVVNEDEIDNSPYVLDFPGEHLIIGTGDRVYVRSILEPKTLNYTIYRKGEPYIDPETKDVLGYEAIFVASTRLEKEGDPATLAITKSGREIRIGDRLMENPKGEFALSYIPEPPAQKINGYIINVMDGVSQIGKYNVVVLNKGADDALKVGHVFDIYQRGRLIVDKVKEGGDSAAIRLPDEKAGALMVFRVFDRISYAIVMEATRAIHVHDKIQTPE